jgi:hypothetical protein
MGRVASYGLYVVIVLGIFELASRLLLAIPFIAEAPPQRCIGVRQ